MLPQSRWAVVYLSFIGRNKWWNNSTVPSVILSHSHYCPIILYRNIYWQEGNFQFLCNCINPDDRARPAIFAQRLL